MMPTSFIAPQLFSYMIKHDKESFSILLVDQPYLEAI